MTKDQEIRLECAKIGGNDTVARLLYAFIMEAVNRPKLKKLVSKAK